MTPLPIPHLRRARLLLGQALRLHLASVDIGRFEAISDSGVADDAIKDARLILEAMDRLCADMDKSLME